MEQWGGGGLGGGLRTKEKTNNKKTTVHGPFEGRGDTGRQRVVQLLLNLGDTRDILEEPAMGA